MLHEQIDWRMLDWKLELSNNIVSFDQLRQHSTFSADEEQELQAVVEVHPINIPRYYMSLIDPADPDDPIRRMCFPALEELVVAGSMGETTPDPYGDDKHDKGNGVLHKYDNTALVVATEYCAMHCRHCFRRRIVGHQAGQPRRDFAEAARYIAGQPGINNVILSGGDPLMLPTPALRSMLMQLAAIDHIQYVRIGTRAPVTYPMRLFDDELVALLDEFNNSKALYLATHFNHVREITPTAAAALRRVRSCGVTINNQAVLLRGVNDSAEAIADLMEGLLAVGVNPYYLYQCMPVSRVRHHFQLPLKQGVRIVDNARARLSGYGTRFKYIIGHDIGKLEICGISGNTIVLKQLHARSGHPEQASRLIMRELDDNDGWLDL